MSEARARLHHFFRSGTSHRLRIALNLKGIDAELIPVDLRKEAHRQPAFKAINPQMLVPALEWQGQTLIQSPAIIEWLDEQFPTPPLLPADPLARARVRAMAALVGCDVHPINNRRILEYLRHELAQEEAAVTRWCQHWISEGFDALEALLAQGETTGPYCHGEQLTLADVYLVPQVESARRFGVDMATWPRIAAIDSACGQLESFRRAAPANQPDAV